MTPSEPQAAFRTHAHYLRAFAHLANPRNLPHRRALEAISRRVERSGILPEAALPQPHAVQVRSSLENAWGTELLLNLGAQVFDEEELIRLSNNWNVVQGYYVLYHAIQAVVVAKGQPRPTSHPKTQEWYHQLLSRRPVYLPPWTLGFGNGGALNIALGVTPNDRIHSWTSCDDTTCWGLACKALRTTREEALPGRIIKRRESKRADRRKAWTEEQRKRINQGRRPRVMRTISLPQLTTSEREEVEERLRPFTLMDYLYRLRLRSNYEDSAMFTDGPEDNIASRQVRDDVSLLCGSTALLAEMYVGRLVGNGRLGRWADTWLARNSPPGWSGGLVARRDLIA